ncbi:MAG: LacI family DNA-binding transcriptional regulator [Trueperaceae bacterium]
MEDVRDVTIVEVAAQAGVSVSTVSRILNNRPDVAKRTRERVLNVIKQLGFEPHAPAQRLAGGKSRTIAVLYPLEQPGEEPVNQLHLDFTIGAATAAGESQYFCNLLTNPVTAESLLGLFRGRNIDGLILMEVYLDDWRVNLLREHELPFTLVGRTADESATDFTDLDIETGVSDAFGHLVTLGHRAIGFLTYAGHLRTNGFGPAVRAWSGYQRSLAAHDLPPIAHELRFTAEDMAEATHALLDEHPGLTAIVSLTDAPTGAVINALIDRGLRVPDDVSVVGLATDRMADMLSPPLTAIQFPAYDMGFMAASRLIHQLERRPEPARSTVVTPQLVVRGTTAAPSAERRPESLPLDRTAG